MYYVVFYDGSGRARAVEAALRAEEARLPEGVEVYRSAGEVLRWVYHLEEGCGTQSFEITPEGVRVTLESASGPLSSILAGEKPTRVEEIGWWCQERGATPYHRAGGGYSRLDAEVVYWEERTGGYGSSTRMTSPSHERGDGVPRRLDKESRLSLVDAADAAARRWNRFAGAVSRVSGRPVGQAHARYWERAGRWTPDEEFIDSRPVRDAMLLGATPEETIAALPLTERSGRGYGSPYTLPMGVALSLAEWGEEGHCDLVAEAMGVSRYPVRGRAYLTRRGGRLHPDYLARAKSLLALGRLNNLLCFERQMRCDPSPVTLDWVGLLRWERTLRKHLDVSPEMARLRMLARAHGGDESLPLYKLRGLYGSPRANWHAMGFKPPAGRGLTLSPYGLPVRQLRQILATAEGDADPQLWDCAVRVQRTWGPLADCMVRACGLHDAGQALVEGPEWEAYRTRYAGWFRQNQHQAQLRLSTLARVLPAGEDPGHPSQVPVEAYTASTPEAQALLAAARLVPYESIPPARAEQGGYVLASLRRGDAKGIVLGELTACCQRLGGAASSCVKHGVTSPDGGFWAITRSGRVVAQSWVWRHGDTVVCDNIELSHVSASEMGRVLPLYKAAAASILGRLGIRRVLVGGGYSKVSLRGLAAGECPPSPRGVYTDVRPGVYVLAEAAP